MQYNPVTRMTVTRTAAVGAVGMLAGQRSVYAVMIYVGVFTRLSPPPLSECGTLANLEPYLPKCQQTVCLWNKVLCVYVLYVYTLLTHQ